MDKMITRLKNFERNLVDEYIDNINKSQYEIPEKYKNTFIRISGSAEFTSVINKIVDLDNKKLKCLVVGLHGGRDYWYLTSKGHEVWGMDLKEYDNVPKMKVGNAEHNWPFEDCEFDIIVLGEILEHLAYDIKALNEAHRVLRNNGKLIITVPYHDSNDIYHIRMFDSVTIKHSLSIAKFNIDDSVERPGIYFKDFLNYVNFILSVLIKFIFNRNIYFKIPNFYGNLEYKLGKINLLRKLLKSLNLINYGGLIVASKKDNNYDYAKVNKEIFS